MLYSCWDTWQSFSSSMLDVTLGVSYRRGRTFPRTIVVTIRIIRIFRCFICNHSPFKSGSCKSIKYGNQCLSKIRTQYHLQNSLEKKRVRWDDKHPTNRIFSGFAYYWRLPTSMPRIRPITIPPTLPPISTIVLSNPKRVPGSVTVSVTVTVTVTVSVTVTVAAGVFSQK